MGLDGDNCFEFALIGSDLSEPKLSGGDVCFEFALLGDGIFALTMLDGGLSEADLPRQLALTSNFERPWYESMARLSELLGTAGLLSADRSLLRGVS